MKRKKFLLNALLTTGGISLLSNIESSAFANAKEKLNTSMTETHPNLILINNFFKAYANNDHEAIKNILAHDIKWHIPGRHPLSGTKIGVDQVMFFFSQLSKASLKAEPIVMGVSDQYVIDCHKNWSTGDGAKLNGMSCLLWRIENNKITEVFNFPEDQHLVDAYFSTIFK
jgi:uncharacterized protein